jgi:hypothetical protein
MLQLWQDPGLVPFKRRRKDIWTLAIQFIAEKGRSNENCQECQGQCGWVVLQELIALHLMVRSGHGGGVAAAWKNITLVEAASGPGGVRHHFSFPEEA